MSSQIHGSPSVQGLSEFSSSLRARRSDSREECAIYHTTNRDTTFCGDQIVSPNTPDRHISLAKLAGAGAVISHRITNYQPQLRLKRKLH